MLGDYPGQYKGLHQTVMLEYRVLLDMKWKTDAFYTFTSCCTSLLLTHSSETTWNIGKVLIYFLDNRTTTKNYDMF